MKKFHFYIAELNGYLQSLMIILMIIVLLLLIAVAVIIYNSVSYRIKIRRTAKIVFGGDKCLPKIKIGNSYGWPCFSIYFKTYEDKEKAEKNGKVTLFKEKINELHKGLKRNNESFDSDIAVSVSYIDPYSRLNP